MDRANKSIVNDYILLSNKDEYNEKDENKLAYNYGYIDAYFDEPTYKALINFESSLTNYEKGYVLGLNERHNTDEIKLKEDKDMWLKRLAAFDGIQNVEGRVFNEDTLKLYQKYRTMVFNTKVLKFGHNKDDVLHKKVK